MVQLAKALYAKSDNLCLIPGTHTVSGRREMNPASCPQTSAHVSMCAHTDILDKYISVKGS